MEFLAHFTLYGTEALHLKVVSIPIPEKLGIKMPSHGDWHCSKPVVCLFLKMTRFYIRLISN